MRGEVHVDGSVGEGGGQVLRQSLGLSAATRRPVRVTGVRAGRGRPGLRAQHLAALRAVAGLCSASVEGAEVGSPEVRMRPTSAPGGQVRVDVGTAGSVTLVLQAALAALSGEDAGEAELSVTGGTDVMGAPTWDYLERVLATALRESGMSLELGCHRRGFHPAGGGRVEARVGGGGGREGPLEPFTPRARGEWRIEGVIVASRLPDHVPRRIDHAIRRELVGMDVAAIERREVDAAGPGVAATLWARSGPAVLGASMPGRRGLRSEDIGAALGGELRADLESGATVDVHLLDQLVAHAALARGTSVLRARELSRHARTALEVVGSFLPVEVSVDEEEGLCVVEVSA